MKKNVSFFLFFAVFLIGCNKNDESNNHGVVVEAVVEFSLLDANNDDLLNASTPGYYPFEKMKLYFVEDGKKIEVYDPEMNDPRRLAIYKSLTPYHLIVYTSDDDTKGIISENDSIKTGISVAYLQLNDEVTDTIKTEWKSGPGYFVNTKVWYNGVLQQHPDTPFEVVKQ